PSTLKDRGTAHTTEMPGLFGMEACETHMVFRRRLPGWLQVLLPPRLKVVSTESAGQYFGQVKYLPGTDHFSTVKPDSLTHPSHEFLETFPRRFRGFLVDLAQETDPSSLQSVAAVKVTEPAIRVSEYFAEQRQIIDHHVARFVPRADAEAALDRFVGANRRGYFIVSG